MNWIKTEEKLPELNKTVLCYKDDDIIISCLIMDEISEDKKIFAPVKHEAGQLRLLQSVFLEEGHEDGGGMTDPDDRFDRLLDAMVNKPPLDVADKEPLADADDLREDDAD